MHAQNDTLVDQIYAVLLLDSVTVIAQQNKPDIKSMIAQTIHDTTFYRAFQRLRRVEYTFTSELYFYHPQWKPHTYMRSKRRQHIRNQIRTHDILEEYIHQNMVNLKSDYIFYTAKMYDRLFYINTPVSVPAIWTDNLDDLPTPDTRMEKYVLSLKKLLFAPGTKIDLPLLGDKTAIFTEKHLDKYIFTLVLDRDSYPEPVYKFKILADPSLPENAMVIKELTTVFDQRTKQVLNRNYQLRYSTVLYNFDVSMYIQVEPSPSGYLPTRIKYEGWWKVPLKKPEWCKFEFNINEL